jgi:hypothetical protein
MHNDAARVQRRAITQFTREYAGKLTDAVLPINIVPENIDDLGADDVEGYIIPPRRIL